MELCKNKVKRQPLAQKRQGGPSVVRPASLGTLGIKTLIVALLVTH